MVRRKPFDERWKAEDAQIVKTRPFSEEDRDNIGKQWLAPYMEEQEELRKETVGCARRPFRGLHVRDARIRSDAGRRVLCATTRVCDARG